MKSLQECSNEKQCASAVVFLKDGKCEIFAEVYPHYRNKKSKNSDSPSTEVTKHSEEILIGQIDEYLQSNGIHVQSILFYTLNSPCLKREKHTDPCMFKLVEMAHQWQSKFGFSTVVAFTKFWGLSGPNFFKDLTYSDISSPSSDFYPYIETCKTIPFKLNSKDFRNNVKKRSIYNTIPYVEVSDKRKLDNDIKSALRDLVKLAESSFGLRKEHLERGEEKISSFTFDPLVQDKSFEFLTKNWNEMVTNCSMSPIREKITTDFNIAVVFLFLKELKSTLGNSSPLRLYCVPQNWFREYVKLIKILYVDHNIM
ncbi:uncharacterized protein LOC122880724 [Siniperca chuatsi]|uniref:uncharacterized protein LOC122880724 n=1 Tax=Siniperca chuatsi TaxID=119488 RepID=UPI001CE1D8AE|nr:uncharacterized protein LOC122880724 [Siniperca chuatsi]XP_044062063.1 uncharacterized protein LOC122880724 [Siniperca chuatsi]